MQTRSTSASAHGWKQRQANGPGTHILGMRELTGPEAEAAIQGEQVQGRVMHANAYALLPSSQR
jgi:hypothetical protein